ncbi:MAG: alpha-glucosidase C-terminal domain-containing protein [Bacteroidales bacterium]|nr:alpha-glucosidase C-terminal domain-containing protein [Bacteroidales bacterium]
MNYNTLLKDYWNELYPGKDSEILDNFLQEAQQYKSSTLSEDSEWYKDAIVYSLYVNLFNNDFSGLIDKLDYLQDLGVSCLWLLPILDSPMRDAGFDIRNYDRVRADLLGLPEGFQKEEQEALFGNFLKEAHNRNIHVIFDIAMNHTSDQHPWFLEAKKSEDNPYRDFYIWSKDTSLYGDARLLFKGIEDSNWEALENTNWYYFHRFFSFQPDLNYRNPKVLLEMTRNLLYWQSMGVDGFRADAIPYIWKEEGTDCENRPKTHTVVKFFRAVLDYVNSGSFLLAEACQKPYEVVKYMGDGDECHAAYHFPLMPMMYKAIAMGNNQPIRHTLSPQVTPTIPSSGQWMTFLRVHDELSLELVYVSEEDRKYIHESYCHKPEWDFRVGEGISARLAELFQKDVNKIALSYSLMLTMTGSPVVYYGDEFGKLNDEKYYHEQIQLTGKDDTRFLVRGRIDWKQLNEDLKDPENFHSKVYAVIKSLLNTRRDHKAFGRGTTKFMDVKDLKGNTREEILAYQRITQEEHILVINNLSSESIEIQNPMPDRSVFVLNLNGFIYDGENETMTLEPNGFVWLGVL